MLVEIRVSPNDAGQRAERFLRRWFPTLSTGRLHSLFRRKEIKIAKTPVDPAYLLKAGEVLQVYGIRDEETQRENPNDAESGTTEVARAGHTRKSAIDYPLPSIVFEDHELMVVNKPSGLAAHPGSGIMPGASLIERVKTYLAGPKVDKNAKRDQEKRKAREEQSDIKSVQKPVQKSGLKSELKSDRAREEWNAERGEGGEPDLESLLFGGSSEGFTPGWGTELFRPALVHRLDKETSGVLLIAKSGPMLRTLTEALREGKIRKRYLALVAGHPSPTSGTIDAALARVDSAYGAKSLIAEDADLGIGKASVTRYKTIKTMGTAKDGHALLQVVIETGRMHQIRAHLAHIGHPIAGDTRYGALRPAEVRERMKALGLTRLFLHAEELSWKDGANKRVFQAPLPEELSKVVGTRPAKPVI